MATPVCIGEPVSWLRLERFALGTPDRRDPVVGEHVAACEACRRCLAEIRADVVALPALHVPQRRTWRWFALPAIAALAGAAVILFLLRPREPDEDRVAHVKGVGEVVIDVVRERGGSVRADVHTFAPGDRFKIVVTCPPTHEVSLDVGVRESGTERVDHPLAPARIVCGNRIVLPGAFELTGTRPHRVCVRIEDRASACLTLTPE